LSTFPPALKLKVETVRRQVVLVSSEVKAIERRWR
jgi:hypothetical protein